MSSTSNSPFQLDRKKLEITFVGFNFVVSILATVAIVILLLMILCYVVWCEYGENIINLRAGETLKIHRLAKPHNIMITKRS